MTDKIHSRGFWLTRDSQDPEARHCFDLPLAEALRDFFIGHSVLDLGCGDGRYTSLFQDAGLVCDGFDGNPYTEEMTGGRCRVLDLSKPPTDVMLPRPYDWVLALEVGEHIPKVYATNFLDTVSFHARHGVVLSWAIPGQPGDGHVNCQPNDYAIDHMQSRGLHYDRGTTALLRARATLPWFPNTLMVYRRPE